jgi:hypothetical protein
VGVRPTPNIWGDAVKKYLPSLIVLAVLCGCGDGAPQKHPSPAPSPSVDASEVDPAKEAEGYPGGHCATNRLGKYFIKDGVVYTCKEPKPYRWMAS